MSRNESYKSFVIQHYYDTALYSRLINYYNDNVYKPSDYGIDHSMYQSFRDWLLDEYRCYNDGSNTFNFKTESDYMWFLLKWK